MASTYYLPSSKNCNSETLAAIASEATGISHADCHSIVRAVVKGMIEEIAQGHRIELRGLGRFKFTVKRERFYPANLSTADRDAVFVVPRRIAPVFKVSRSLELRVAKLKVPEK